MSEKNQSRGPEIVAHDAEHENQQHEVEQIRHEKQQEAPEPRQEQSVDKLVEKAEAEAVSSSEYNKQEKEDSKGHPALVNKQLKDMAYSRALVRTRKHLSAPSRLFSKAIHSKALDKPSEAIGKTIARPSGMIGGAVFALVGSSLLLWITRNYGYEYNYLAAILLFAAGMVVGITIEGLFKLKKRKN